MNTHIQLVFKAEQQLIKIRKLMDTNQKVNKSIWTKFTPYDSSGFTTFTAEKNLISEAHAQLAMP